MQIARDESGRVLKVAGPLGIAIAGELHQALLDLLCGDGRPIVDLSAVDACDAAALQLLCSAEKTAEHSGKRLELAGVSTAIRTASAALGLKLPEATVNRGDEDAV